jgi:mannose-6-phosphate isomerase-like protein (cupin superfamily)
MFWHPDYQSTRRTIKVSRAKPYVLAPGAEIRDLNGLALKAGTAETDGAIAVYEGARPGHTSGPALHVHDCEDEARYVIEGEATVQLGDEVSTAASGSFIWMPRGVPHTFANLGDAPLRLLGFAVPSGVEELFASLPRDQSQLDPAKIAEIDELAGRYGARTVGPPISACK